MFYISYILDARLMVKSYKAKKRRSSVKSSFLSKLKTGTAGKVLIGLGAAQLAGLVAGMVVPQYVGIAKPIAALAAGGIPAVAAELVLDQGILGNVMGFFGGNGGMVAAQEVGGL